MKKAITKTKTVRIRGKKISLAKVRANRTHAANKSLAATDKAFKKIERESEVTHQRMNTPFNV